MNQSAAYVVAFLPAGARGMRLEGRVPPHETWRAFYGAMAISYTTTATTSSLDGAQLGGWGGRFVLFAAHDEAGAQAGGYDGRDPTHRLLLWRGCDVPGLVLRSLHYCDASSGLTEQQVAAAVDERRRLRGLDGTRTRLESEPISGVGLLEYFW